MRLMEAKSTLSESSLRQLRTTGTGKGGELLALLVSAKAVLAGKVTVVADHGQEIAPDSDSDSATVDPACLDKVLEDDQALATGQAMDAVTVRAEEKATEQPGSLAKEPKDVQEKDDVV